MTLQIDRLEAEMRMAMDIDDWERVESLAAQMDLLDIHKPPPPLPNVALWYAEQGLHVFPLEPKGKRPYPGGHGCKEATADLDQVRAWWSARPEANIGIATGRVVDVIDIDGPTGVASYVHELLDDNGQWLGPHCLGRVSTPRPGGHHIYVAADADRRNKAALLPGIDTRATGGYVVAPPSVTEQGVYQWTMPLDLP